MEGYALDPNMLVSALTNRDNDTFGGNNGLLWIFLLLLFGGNGWGAFGRNGEVINDSAITGNIEAALNKAQANGCSNDLILTAINGNKEAISTLGNTLGFNYNQIDNALRGLERGLCDLGYKLGTDTARIISEINSGNAALTKQLSDCCCSTQRAIDGVNYNMATGFANLQNNMDRSFCNLERNIDNKLDAQTTEMRAGFQGIRDYLTNEKIESLQLELQATQLSFQNAQQTQTLKDYISSICKPATTSTGGTSPTTLTLK